MARFLVTYHGGEMPHDPESMARARDAFLQWAARTGPALVEPGAPVMATRMLSAGGVNDAAEAAVSGWSVLEAPDADAAIDLLRDHPFIGRGGTLQVSTPVEF